MLSQKKFNQLIDETYEILYKLAIPSVDFQTLVAECTLYRDEMGNPVRTEKPLTKEEMIERGLTKDLDFYSYFVPKEVYDATVNNLVKKYKCYGSDRHSYFMIAYLGAGPSSSPDRWLEKHPEFTLEDLQKMVDEREYDKVFELKKPIIVKKNM